MSRLLLKGAGLMLVAGVAHAQSRSAEQEMPARQIFVAACANCHASDGRGATQSQVGFSEELPDFTDCSRSSRETAQDWSAIVHNGGLVRGLSHRMPAFGTALTNDQIERVVAYVRTLCDDRSWPRGELNLPRAMVTEKAFPEDEAVFAMSGVRRDGVRTLEGTLLYEKRIGARNQWELAIPFGLREKPGAGSKTWSGATLGDIAVAFKSTLFHDDEAGRILSGGAEVLLPTGDVDSGAGGGVTIFEPFLLAAQALPANAFLQLHTGFETPVGHQAVDRAVYLRMAAGTTLTSGFGRSWSPIVEVIADRELSDGAKTQWDWIPQLQVSLSKLQHVLASIGVRLPLTDRARPRELVAYVIWDWFDGGFSSGW